MAADVVAYNGTDPSGPRLVFWSNPPMVREAAATSTVKRETFMDFLRKAD